MRIAVSTYNKTRVLSLSANLFEKPQLDVIIAGIEKGDLNNIYQGWSLFHICAFMSDSLTRPNPAFSHPLLKDILKEDGIVDLVEERTHYLMELCKLLVTDPSQINQQDSLYRRPIDLTTYEPLIDLLLANDAVLLTDRPNPGPLHFSAALPHKDALIHLIKGADPVKPPLNWTKKHRELERVLRN